MKKNFFKKLALVMALTLAVGSVPATNVEAAAAPAFKSVAKGANLVEGQTKNYGIANVSAWSVKKIVVGNKKVATVVKSGKTAKITGVAEGKTTVRADLMAYKTKRTKSIRMSVNVKALVPEATGVAATAAKKITVSGVALNKFALADVAVTGYNVVSYTPAADGKSAVIALDRMMVPNTEIEVKVADFTGKVTYNFEVAALAIVPGTFDDDLKGQTVKFTVNGEEVEAQDLVDNGYTVNFSAKTAAGALADTFFVNPVLGVINTDNAHGVYKVCVTVSNGTTVVTSPYTDVVITDLHASINSIDSYKLKNSTSGFNQNSTKLIHGETATFEAIYATVDGIKDCNISAGVTVTSSNPEVIAVSGNSIKAETTGTATITLAYGSVTKTMPFEVKLGTRVFTKAVAVDGDMYYDPVFKTNSKQIVSDTHAPKTENLYVLPLDQFGDPMVAGTKVYAGIPGTGSNIASTGAVTFIASASTDSTSGTAIIPVGLVTGAAGNVNIIVQKAPSQSATNQTNTETVLTFTYVVSNKDTANTTKLVVVAEQTTDSDDAVLDLYGDNTATLKLAQYNEDNVLIGYKNFETTDYQLTTTNPNVVTVAALGTTASQTVTGVGVGTATVTLSKVSGSSLHPVAHVTFTVTDKTPVFGGLTYKTLNTITAKNVTVDYTSFLNVTTATTADAIVSGVTVKNLTTTSTVRATEKSFGSDTYIMLYLDRDDDGTFDDTAVDGKPVDIALALLEVNPTQDSAFTAANVTANLSVKTDVGNNGFVKLTVYSVDTTGQTKGVAIDASKTIAVKVPSL